MQETFSHPQTTMQPRLILNFSTYPIALPTNSFSFHTWTAFTTFSWLLTRANKQAVEGRSLELFFFFSPKKKVESNFSAYVIPATYPSIVFFSRPSSASVTCVSLLFVLKTPSSRRSVASVVKRISVGVGANILTCFISIRTNTVAGCYEMTENLTTLCASVDINIVQRRTNTTTMTSDDEERKISIPLLRHENHVG